MQETSHTRLSASTGSRGPTYRPTRRDLAKAPPLQGPRLLGDDRLNLAPFGTHTLSIRYGFTKSVRGHAVSQSIFRRRWNVESDTMTNALLDSLKCALLAEDSSDPVAPYCCYRSVGIHSDLHGTNNDQEPANTSYCTVADEFAAIPAIALTSHLGWLNSGLAS